jgi:predicted O-methyltransferase YrrM
MTQEQWTKVDTYLSDIFVEKNPVLEAALAASDAAGLPSIQVSPPQGKLLHLLARLQGARRILEIGTLGGYSTIWLARALPEDGRLVTLEANPRHADVARANFSKGGLTGKIELQLGPAIESLSKLIEAKCEPFDLIFIDADKENNAEYFSSALKLSRTGSVIIVDNVIRNGEVVDASSQNSMILGTRRMNDRIKAEARVSATTLQTVGSKGYDGFAFILVLN